MKKIYLAGSGGMLGEAFYEVFNNEYIIQASDINLTEKWINYLDFRDFKKYRDDVMSFNPDYLFHLGAITSLEECDLDQDTAYSTNTLAVEKEFSSLTNQATKEASSSTLTNLPLGIFDLIYSIKSSETCSRILV